jgi:uncharacterized membrane protein HdeD (DUF308 family)
MGTTSPASFVRKSIGWSIALSVLMIVAGILAIALPLAAGIAVNVLVAWLLVFSGCAHFVFAWRRPSTGGFVWELILGLLYALIGGYLFLHPVRGLESLTIALAIYLFLEAVLEFVLGFTLRPLPGSGWLILDAIVSLILAVMIWRTWPWSTGWIIGILVGISMLFSGIARLAISITAHRITRKMA